MGKKLKEGFIYLIGDEIGKYVKIGLTTGPVELRLRDLQIGNPYTLMIINSFECNYPRRIELELHNKFKHLHHRGEWFIFDYEIYEEFENRKLTESISKSNVEYGNYITEFHNSVELYEKCNDPSITYGTYLKILFHNIQNSTDILIDPEYKFNFGKYKGYRAKDIPKQYLIWCQENIEHKKLRIETKIFYEQITNHF